MATNMFHIPMRRHLKTRFPALNTRRLAEPFATDTWFSKTKSIEGYTCAQLFVGMESGIGNSQKHLTKEFFGLQTRH
ncbi:MAG: hypothetical protein ACREOZ_04755 [Gloeomargaritales cyanobacterium]